MEVFSVIAVLIVGALLGALPVAFALSSRRRLEAEGIRAEASAEAEGLRAELAAERRQVAALSDTLGKREATLQELTRELAQARERLADIGARRESESHAATEREALLEEQKQRLREMFQALSGEALAAASKQFLQLARGEMEKGQQAAAGELEKRREAIETLVKPLRESLSQMGQRMDAMEKARVSAYAGLSEQVRQMLETSSRLQLETGNLVTALRSPGVRGRWGEMQLRRAVELAGMLQYVDFVEQVSVEGEQGKQRPDMIVRLPGGRSVVVDAKAPLTACLDAMAATEPGLRQEALVRHARHIREHLKGLGAKAYWKQFERTPEFVLLFLPGESFFSAALEQDPELIDFGVENRCILATPTTLIALLKAVAYGWRQEEVAREAQAIYAVARELQERLSLFGKKLGDVGSRLAKAVEAYNESVGSLEARVMPTLRKFEKFDSLEKDKTPSVEKLDIRPRSLESSDAPTPQGPEEA